MPPAQPELKKVRFPPFQVALAAIYVCVCLTRLGTTANHETRTLQYLDKRLFVQLNGSRKVIGILRGYDVRIIPTSRSPPPPPPPLPSPNLSHEETTR